MAFIINVYKTSDYLDAYSKDQALDDPVFNYPPVDWNGQAGQTRDVELFMRNDGDLIGRNMTVTPVDLSGSDETGWVKLATSQAGLDAATPGAGLSIAGDFSPTDTFTFWERITVPASTSVQTKTDLALRIDAQAFAS